MTRGRWPSLLALGLLLAAPLVARAQNFGLGVNGQSSDKPMDIQADNGIEWQQTNRVYIARGNARATRGQATVYGDTLMAFYRPTCSPEALVQMAIRAAKAATAAVRAPAPGAPANQPAAKPEPPRNCPDPAPTPAGQSAPAKTGEDPVGGNSTEIYRIEASGNVRIVTETQTVYGDHSIYDVDAATLVVTGQHLKLETQRDTVTARDSLEWYDDKQLAVARGDAVELREGKRLRGDVLLGEVAKDTSGSSHISHIDARGNVLVSSQDQIARGDSGVYDLDTGIATLKGRVSLTRGENEITGQYAVVDLNKNISHILPRDPDTKGKDGAPGDRVHGELRRQAGAPPKDEPATKAPAPPATKAPAPPTTKVPAAPAAAKEASQ